jgi:hypothetical protein
MQLSEQPAKYRIRGCRVVADLKYLVFVTTTAGELDTLLPIPQTDATAKYERENYCTCHTFDSRMVIVQAHRCQLLAIWMKADGTHATIVEACGNSCSQ